MHEIIGAGPTLVFTPGWMMKKDVWVRQAPLAEHFRLVFWDLPEHGPKQTPLLLEHCAAALQDLVAVLGTDKMTYVGWSMGMSVFWKYLELYGEAAFAAVINVEMVPKMDPKATQVEAVERSMHRDRRHATEKFLRRALYHPEAAALSRFVETACALPLDSVLSVYRDMAEADFSSIASHYRGRQHLAFGRHGFYADHEAELANFFPHQNIHWFENSAHVPFWEEAGVFNDWLNSLFR